MKLGIIACQVFEDEVRHFLASLPPVAAVEMLEQGLHDNPDLLRQRLQEKVAAMEEQHAPDAVALVYGLCSRGVEGVSARRARLVVPRAHDCITVLLGCRKRYAEYVARHPAAYWYSPGWNRCHVPPGQERWERARRGYIEKYGEDEADYLMEMEQQWMRHYNRAVFVHLGAGPVAEEEANTRRCAEWLQWEMESLEGDPDLLVSLLAGRWDAERFLVLAPGETVRLTADDRIVCAAPCKGCPSGAAGAAERANG